MSGSLDSTGGCIAARRRMALFSRSLGGHPCSELLGDHHGSRSSLACIRSREDDLDAVFQYSSFFQERLS